MTQERERARLFKHSIFFSIKVPVLDQVQFMLHPYRKAIELNTGCRLAYQAHYVPSTEFYWSVLTVSYTNSYNSVVKLSNTYISGNLMQFKLH